MQRADLVDELAQARVASLARGATDETCPLVTHLEVFEASAHLVEALAPGAHRPRATPCPKERGATRDLAPQVLGLAHVLVGGLGLGVARPVPARQPLPTRARRRKRRRKR